MAGASSHQLEYRYIIVGIPPYRGQEMTPLDNMVLAPQQIAAVPLRRSRYWTVAT